MARKPSEAKIREFEALKRFFTHWLLHISPFPNIAASDPIHPLNVLTRFEQNFPYSQVLAGLQQAVNDALEETEDWSRDMIHAADASLLAAGAPTLSGLLISQSRHFRRIVRRGCLRNDTEYYLVSAALSDTGKDRSAQETALLAGMLSSYEARI
jgi:hypothetical protein